MKSAGRKRREVLRLSDEELLSLVRAHHEYAFEELVRRHEDAARRAARRACRRDADVEDAVNAALINTYSAIRRGKGPTESFRAYIARAATISALESTRNLSYSEIPVDEFGGDIASAPSDHSPMAEVDIALVNRVVAAMPERWRIVVSQMKADLPGHETAAALGINPNALAALSFRARAGFRLAFVEAVAGDATSRHRWVHERLDADSDGDLSLDEHLVVRHHLTVCKDCRGLLRHAKPAPSGATQ